jgi:hypothetical protein
LSHSRGSLRSAEPLRLPDASEQLSRYLYRPIVVREPDRLVYPPSWIEHIPFAFWIVDVVRPDVLVELGTQSGNSYAAFAQAVQMLGLQTSAYAVDTWRGDPHAGPYDESVFRDWTAYHDRHFSAFSRLIRSTFEDAAQHFSDGSVDLLHIDGYHTYEAATADVEHWLPKLSRRGVMLIHDINVRERDFGTWRMWEQLRRHSPFFEFLHGSGLGVLAPGPELPDALRWLCSRMSSSAQDVSDIRQFFAHIGRGIAAHYMVQEAQGAELETLSSRLQQTSAQLRRRDNEVAQQSVELSRLTSEVTQLRDQVAASRLDVQEKDIALARRTRLTAALQDGLRNEAARRRKAEEERNQLREASSRSMFTKVRQGIKRVESGLRRRLRYLREASRTPGALGLLPTGRGWRPLAGLAFLAHPARIRDAHAIVVSGLFNEDYYRASYRDVAESRLTPLAHFVLNGRSEARRPHPLFDSAYYLRRNPDVALAGVNPLVHYLRHGAVEGRSPHPLFDVAYYLTENPDVAKAGIEPLAHFLRFGAVDGRDPNPFFDSSYYLTHSPDVAARKMNPLTHFVCDGWREGRRPSAAFDPAYYLEQSADARSAGENPLVHYLEYGRLAGHRAVAEDASVESLGPDAGSHLSNIRLNVRSLQPSSRVHPTVLCLSHVMPLPPRAGNEYRIYRLLRWLRDQGYRVLPVIAPLPGQPVDSEALRSLADEFSNAVLCDRDGRLEYVLRDVPDVLTSLRGQFACSASVLLDEDNVREEHERLLQQMDRAFCHDALITTVLRLQQVLRPDVLLAEYIWMSRVLPLIPDDVVKVIDTIDVFSDKRDKVLRFGISDIHVDRHEEARRLQHADLILAIQDDERETLQQLMPGKRVVTTGVDFDVIADGGLPSGRHVLCVASDNPMNRKGLLDFLRFAWPYVKQEVREAELVVAGRIGAALPPDVPGVTRLGLVDDLAPLYSQARLVINPSVAGTGVKIKTLEALSHLRPVVTWPNGADGLAPELAGLCVTARDWFEFSRVVAAQLAAEHPRLFSATERDTIARLTSPSATYRAMTEAISALRTERCAFDPPGSAIVA